MCELDLRDLRDGIRLRCIFSVPSHSAVEETPLRCILSVPTHSAVQSSIHGFNQLPILRSSRVVLVCSGRGAFWHALCSIHAGVGKLLNVCPVLAAAKRRV